jgi:hypothetical protein
MVPTFVGRTTDIADGHAGGAAGICSWTTHRTRTPGRAAAVSIDWNGIVNGAAVPNYSLSSTSGWPGRSPIGRPSWWTIPGRR